MTFTFDLFVLNPYTQHKYSGYVVLHLVVFNYPVNIDRQTDRGHTVDYRIYSLPHSL